MPETKKIPAGMAVASAEHARIMSMPTDSGWQEKHLQAWYDCERGLGQSIGGMIRWWLVYADSHSQRFESTIGEDGVLGPEWAAIGAGLLGLLNGETGRFDCGTLDAIIGNSLDAEGFDRQGHGIHEVRPMPDHSPDGRSE